MPPSITKEIDLNQDHLCIGREVIYIGGYTFTVRLSAIKELFQLAGVEQTWKHEGVSCKKIVEFLRTAGISIGTVNFNPPRSRRNISMLWMGR
jgi:hypothetical protein